MVALLELPAEVLYLILWELRDSPKTLLLVDQVCRKIHQLASASFWKDLYDYKYLPVLGLEVLSERSKEAVKLYSRQACRDCETYDHALTVHPIEKAILCGPCFFNPKYEMYTSSDSKSLFSLNAKDLEDLPHLTEPNPHHPKWAPMKMYCAHDLWRVAEAKRRVKEEKARLREERAALVREQSVQLAAKRKEVLRKEFSKFDHDIDEDLEESDYKEYLEKGRPAAKSVVQSLLPLLDRRTELKEKLEENGIDYSMHKERLEKWVRNPIASMKEVIDALTK